MKFGITQNFECAYLPDRQERLLVAMEPLDVPYDRLIQLGFRRSGDQIYRPHCPSCSACQSIRISASGFAADRRQRRVLKKNADLTVTLTQQVSDEYYPLYQRYITARHRDGSMYPPSEAQFESFIHGQSIEQGFIEIRNERELIAVAVCDIVNDGLSAVYTFFDCQFEQRSLGVFAILSQILIAKQLKLPFVYLGYQVDECNKMNYKDKFYPHQRFIEDKWVDFAKKAP